MGPASSNVRGCVICATQSEGSLAMTIPSMSENDRRSRWSEGTTGDPDNRLLYGTDDDRGLVISGLLFPSSGIELSDVAPLSSCEMSVDFVNESE